MFQEKFIRSFKGVSSFVLQFCCSMNLIAATRAEGGLVKYGTDNWYSAQRQARQKAAQEKQETNHYISKYKTMKYI